MDDDALNQFEKSLAELTEEFAQLFETLTQVIGDRLGRDPADFFKLSTKPNVWGVVDIEFLEFIRDGDHTEEERKLISELREIQKRLMALSDAETLRRRSH